MTDNNNLSFPARKIKSQSKRIRDILYRIWEQNPENMDAEEFYSDKTEKYIEFLLKKLETPIPEEIK
jgi:hypothetical protein